MRSEVNERNVHRASLNTPELFWPGVLRSIRAGCRVIKNTTRACNKKMIALEVGGSVMFM